MNFPEQEEFTVEDVAARWGKSVSYVQDLTRRRLLPLNRHRLSGSMKLGWKIKSFIAREHLERFEHAAAVSHGSWKHLKEAAKFLDMSEKTLRLRLKQGKFKKGFDGKRLIVWVPSQL